ncbi:Cohesin subunit psc3, partial [Varanus komodoensis]
NRFKLSPDARLGRTSEPDLQQRPCSGNPPRRRLGDRVPGGGPSLRWRPDYGMHSPERFAWRQHYIPFSASSYVTWRPTLKHMAQRAKSKGRAPLIHILKVCQKVRNGLWTTHNEEALGRYQAEELPIWKTPSSVSYMEKRYNVNVHLQEVGQLETLEDVLTGQILRISRGRDTVIMGDFSLPDITWETHSAVTARSHRFLEAIEGGFFTLRVQEATRGGNILDLVLTNREELIDEVQIRGALDASDHSILCFEIRGLGTCSRSSTRSWDFKRANFGQLKARLRKVSWDRLQEGKQVEEGWMALKREVLEAQALTIPLVSKVGRRRRVPPWIRKEVVRGIRRKRNLRRKWELGQIDKRVYREEEAPCRRIPRKAKADYELRLAKNIKSNKKGFFQHVNRKRKGRQVVGPLNKEEGDPVTDMREQAQMLNDYFASVFSPKQDGGDPHRRLDEAGDLGAQIRVTPPPLK